MKTEYAIETGTVTFDNGKEQITLKGNWQCTDEHVTSQGLLYSEVSVLGVLL